MKEKKLPFKSYTVVNNEAAFKLNCSDVYRFYVLSLTADKTTLQTDTTLEQLATFIGEKVTAYKGNSKSNSFTDRLRESGEVKIETTYDKSINSDKTVSRNTYTFKSPVINQYRRISRSLIELDLSIKLKGYIIKLFSITNPHSYIIEKSQNELAKLLKMDKQTIKKYNEELINAGFLENTEKGLLLKIDSLIIDKPNRIPKEVQAIFNAFDQIIKSKIDNEIELSKSEAIYLSAKKDNFEQIYDLRGWSIWLVSGVSSKSKINQQPTIIL